MAKTGPRPAPSAIRRARHQRADRLNPAEPIPVSVSGPPEPPSWLGPLARAEWDRLAPDLWRARVLSVWDVQTFAAYCDLTEQLHRAHAGLEPGLAVRGRRESEVVTSPAFRIYRDLLVLLRIYSIEFGLTPSARSQIWVTPPPPKLPPAEDSEP